MARYVGDLTDPENSEQREKAAVTVERIADSIRNRKVRYLNIAYDRDVIMDPSVIGVEPQLSAWTIDMDMTHRGRHEEATDGD